MESADQVSTPSPEEELSFSAKTIVALKVFYKIYFCIHYGIATYTCQVAGFFPWIHNSQVVFLGNSITNLVGVGITYKVGVGG